MNATQLAELAQRQAMPTPVETPAPRPYTIRSYVIGALERISKQCQTIARDYDADKT